MAEFVGQDVVMCGLIIEQRTHHQVTGEPMKFLTLADRTGMVETELFADTYRSYGLATVRYPVLEIGTLAGQPNQHFLDADLFHRAFLAPCETVRPMVGLLIFEFSRFYPTDYEHGRDFTADLDAFLGKTARRVALRR